ncbi:unnamed protein product [Didymodactylos carnosus]|nr:unnamed protein product [Didymodactylos carnosus]CAF3938768.1 unnamed protein product [Didymodactylos carnosus]
MFDSNLIESQLDEIDMTKTIPCASALNWIIDFLYTSSIILNDKNVLPLLTCSFCLQLNSLSDLCISYLVDQLHSSNCVGLLLYAKEYQCEQLETIAQNYVYDHFEDVVRNEEFLNLTASDLYNMIKDDKVKVKCESIIYNAVMQWVRHDPIQRRSELEGLLPCVRLYFLDPSFLQRAKCDEIYGGDDMRKCQEYLSQVYNKLTSHTYCRLPPRRQPIKPLVIYCAGGYFNKSINIMECYFLETRTWQRCADLTVSRSGAGVASLQMRVYVIGGRHNTSRDNKDCSDVERYNPFQNKWEICKSMNLPRNRLGVGVIDNSLYALGGSSGQTFHNSVERYSLKTDSWEFVSPMHTPRIGLAVTTNSRLLFALGGYDGTKRLNDVESYNPDMNLWTKEAPMQISRSGAGACSFENLIYVVGGYTTNDSVATQLDSVERYDVLSNQWTFVRSLHCRRSALSCVLLDRKIHAMGGYDGKNFSSVVEVYDPDTDTWEFGTSLTSERSGHGSALTVEPTLDS